MHVRATPLASSAVTLCAGMAAMFVSMCLALPRPWWVLMTVYVTTQPLAGSLRPKLTYRLGGVVVGATFAVVATTLLINSPFVMSLALALWVGTCLFFAVLDRTPRTFFFMLSGYTAAIVAFPYIDQPAEIFPIALARVEEMFLAITFTIVAHSVVLPWDPASILSGRLPAFLADARKWLVDAFNGHRGFKVDEERRRFAADIAELSIMSVHLPPEALRGGASRRTVAAYQASMSILLPLASAADDRIHALRERTALREPFLGLVNSVTEWLANDADHSRVAAEALQARCKALAPSLDASADWDTLLTGSLCQRLAELIGAYADSHELMRQIVDGEEGNPRLIGRLTRRGPLRLRTDRGVALLSGAATAVAILLYCTFWILASWPEGLATAAFAAIVSCSFASQDDPSPAILKYLCFTIAAMPVSAVYLFVILPRVDGVLMLAIALAPALLVMGYIQADPKRSPYALPMLACFIVAMGFLERYTADFARFLNVWMAQTGGVIVTIGPAWLFRSVGADWTARRLLRRSWRDVAALAGDREPPDEIAWSHRMVDRLGLIAARMAYLRPWENAQVDGLNDLRIGRSVLQLRRTRALITEPKVARRLGVVLGRLAAFYAERVRRASPIAPPPALLHALDNALTQLGRAGNGDAPTGAFDESRRQALLALTGLRRNLFAHAPAFDKALTT